MRLSSIFGSKIMVLMIFVPLGLSAERMGLNSAMIFCFNFLAIVPLAGILGAATESMASHTGEMIGGLLNATFGNAVAGGPVSLVEFRALLRGDDHVHAGGEGWFGGGGSRQPAARIVLEPDAVEVGLRALQLALSAGHGDLLPGPGAHVGCPKVLG